MRKYQLEISGEDQAPPAFDGLWVGMQVAVDAHVELAFLTAGGSPARRWFPAALRSRAITHIMHAHFQCASSISSSSARNMARPSTWSLTLEEI